MNNYHIKEETKYKPGTLSKSKMWKYVSQLRIGSENIFSHYVWEAKLRFSFGLSKSREELLRRCGSLKMQKISQTEPRLAAVTIWKGWGMSWWQLATLIICVGFQRCGVLELDMIILEVDWEIFFQGGGMSWWQLTTLTICVGFWRRDISDFEMLFLEFDWVIVKTYPQQRHQNLLS